MFLKAQPVWLKGREREMNVYAAMPCTLPGGDGMTLHVAGTAFYRAWADGAFLASGPARTAGGYVREDVLALPHGTREVLIETVGYFCRSLCTVWQPSCLLAEVRRGDEVLFATGADTPIYAPPHKVQKTERYSVQRHFTEVWDLRQGSPVEPRYLARAAVVEPAPAVLPRRAPYPVYRRVDAEESVCRGTLVYDETLPCRRQRYSWPTVPEEWGIFDWEEIPYHPHAWIQQQRQQVTDRRVSLPTTLGAGEYALLDLGRIECGFLRLAVNCRQESDVVVAFAEHCEDAPEDQFRYPNINVHNAVEWLAPEGAQELLSFEPYTCRKALVAVKSGSVTLESFGVLTYMLDDADYARPAFKDPELAAIYETAIRNYTHNAVDLYMDCPSRERAGWLGDACYTSQTEFALTGESRTEEAFLENLRLYVNRGEYLDGALPEAFPSDPPPDDPHDLGQKKSGGGVFIPQFILWFLMEVSDYLTVRGHGAEAPLFRPVVDSTLGFFRRHENSEGLLEDLPMWNFVEWSRANDWSRNVNYPTNFFYAEVLQRMGTLYGEKDWLRRSGEIRRLAAAQSFDGQCFRDHALRMPDGTLAVQPERSEVCQYYAALYGGIDLNEARYAELRRLILEVFSPDRKDGEILPIEMIFGAYMRMTLLERMGQRELLLRDIKKLFGHMVDDGGTLWEYRSGKGSRDHGMASYVAVMLQKAAEQG